MPAPTLWIDSYNYNSSFKIGDSRHYVNLPTQGWEALNDWTVADAKAQQLANLLGGASYALPSVITRTLFRASNNVMPENRQGTINETLRFLVTDSVTGISGQAIIRIPEYKGFATQAEYQTFVESVAGCIAMFTPLDNVQFLG